MSTRAELVAELHALAAYVSTCAQRADGTPSAIRERMHSIALVLADAPEPRAAGPAGQCPERLHGFRCLLSTRHFGDHEFDAQQLASE